MKKISLFAAMLAIAASCTVSEIDSIKETTAPEIFASYESNGTKTTITTDDEGVGTIWWKPADEINIFYGTASTHYVSKNKENATTVAFGTTDIIGSTETSQNNIWGLYPYDEDAECDGTSVSTKVSAMQKGVAETFDDDLFTSLAHSTNTTMTFYNVLGGIKFSLSRDDIKKITFKGNNNEDIAGKVKLKMDANGKPVAEVTGGEKAITITPKEGATFAKNTNYYLVMLPTTLSKGFTMTFETETKIGKFLYSEKSIEIKRSVFSKKENIDSYATFKNKDDDELNPFTISSIGNTSVELVKKGSPDEIILEYRKGTESWSAYTIGTSINLEDGEFVQFRAGEGGNEYFSKVLNGNYHYYYVSATGTGFIKASGNIMSLLDKNMERQSLTNGVFNHLFVACKNLSDASKLKLPATTLVDYCYADMFTGCTSLQTAPELPATTLAPYCYTYMFSGCDNLQTAPELPATTLAPFCYSYMFYYCTNLQTVHKLPATTLADYCYTYMFFDCSNLHTAPELSATTLAYRCCYQMFSHSTSLETVSKLPATTLSPACYEDMFCDCTSLETAPELPATTLASGCYSQMFYGCTSLQTAPELPATTLASSCYSQMFHSCTSLQTAPELPATTLAGYCYQAMFSGCTSLETAPELPATTLADYCYDWMFYGCTNLKTAQELPATTLAKFCYRDMFHSCTNLKIAPELPATTLAEECYSHMFYGCTSLETAPELPATTLAEECYSSMFSGCTSLETAPELPATTLAPDCYHSMFCLCTSLQTAPELPATILASSCYENMFSQCSNLQTAPELPATTLALYCYQYMFYGCSNLNYVKALFETTPSDTYTKDWLGGVSSTGTFVKSKNATWDVTGPNGIPEGWTVQIAE